MGAKRGSEIGVDGQRGRALAPVETGGSEARGRRGHVGILVDGLHTVHWGGHVGSKLRF